MRIVGSLEISPSASLSITGSSIAIEGQANIAGVLNADNANLKQGSWNVLSGGQMNVQSACSLQSIDSVNIFGTFNYLSLLSSSVSNVSISSSGVFNHIGTGALSGQITNDGTYLVQAGKSLIGGNFVNRNNFTLSGNGSLSLTTLSQSASSGQVNILNSTMRVSQLVNITGGGVEMGGKVFTPLFLYSSPDGIFKIRTSLNIIGNLTLTDSSSLFLNIFGPNLMDSFNVTGTLVLNSFVMMYSPTGYVHQIGDQISFAKAGSIQSDVQNLYLLGAPFRNVKYNLDLSRGTVAFEFIFSFGSVNNPGYDCHYLGNKKTLEMNRFPIQQKIMLSLTTPIRNSYIGFGFDSNGTIGSSVLTLSYQNMTIQQWNHDSNVKNPVYIIATATISKTIFGFVAGSSQSIGPDYTTISLLIPSTYLASQQWIYYGEIPALLHPNGSLIGPSNTSHFFEKILFSIYSIPKSQWQDCTTFIQPQRAEIYSYAATAIMLILYIAIGILCIIFSRFRPINTRGISPFLTLFFLFLQLLLEMRSYAEITSPQNSLCFYYAFAMYPLQQIVFIMILLYFLRYFSIINLNANKNNVYSQIAVGEDAERFQRFKLRALKIFTSTWLTTGLVIGSYVVLSFVFFLFLAGWKFVCQFDTLLTIKTVNNVELILIYGLTLVSLIGDMIPNAKLLFVQWKWIDYIFHQDPYWFRAQIVLFIPFMIYSLIIEIYTLASTSSYLGVVSKFQETIALNTVQASILLIIDVIFPLVITMFGWMKSKLQKKVSVNALDKALVDPEVEPLFAEFCKLEFSIENLSCWQDIQAFKKNKGDPMVVYNKFFNGPDSVMEVNCPRKTCLVILEKIKSGEIDEHIFDACEKDVITNLCDTYSRFPQWEKYVTYAQGKAKNLELIEGK